MSEQIKARLYQYYQLTRLDKPIGIYLLLWPCMWGLWIAAEGVPDLKVLLVFVLGVVLMRSAGCAINDYADHEFDAHVFRTKQRPLVSGAVSKKEALLVAGGLSLAAFLLVLLLNPLTIYLSLVAVVLAAVYPFMKRYTYLPQVFLGLAFGWGVPMAFAAQTGSVPQLAWLVLMATVLWATAYDTIYAMMDRKDDLRIGVKSTAILFGDADRVIIGILQGLVILVLILVGRQAGLGVFYYLGLMVAAGLAGYQLYLIRQREPAQCLAAFKSNHWLGAAVFAGLVADYL